MTDNGLSPPAGRRHPGVTWAYRTLAVQCGGFAAPPGCLEGSAAGAGLTGTAAPRTLARMSAADADLASPARQVRRLLRAADRATLATALAGPPAGPAMDDAAGWPYASLVLLAVDQTAAPLLLISDLAEHTRNIRADGRVSLLVDGTAGLADPLTGARASLLGRAVPCDSAAALARYVARHPSAAGYAGFRDFHLFRLEVVAAHLVAGFGRIHWTGAGDILDQEAPALAEAEPEIIAHMNADHADALGLMARAADLAAGGWTMTGIDPEGIDIRWEGRIGRVAFATRVEDAAAARAELVRLTRAARTAAPASSRERAG